MAGKPVGTIFAELALDTTSYTKSQREILASASATALNVEKNWKVIGEKSDVMYDAMRQRIENAYQRIANSATSTQQEIVRAQQAAADKIKSINGQQYGHQTSLLDTMKKNWVAVAAGAMAAYLVIDKAMAVMAQAHRVQEQITMLDKLGKQWGVTGQEIIDRSKAAAQGLLSTGEAASISAKGILAGMAPQQMEAMIPLAERLSRVWGTDVAGAFEMLSTVLMTGRERMIKKYGVTLDLTKAYKDFAQANNIAVDQMDAEMKMYVGLNQMTLKRTQIMAVLGAYEDDAMKGHERTKVAIQGLIREMGLGLIGALTTVRQFYLDHTSAVVAATAAVVAFTLAQVALATFTSVTFIPAILAAATAVKAFTLAMMANPVVLLFAVSIGALAWAYYDLKGKVDAAKKAQEEFMTTFRGETLGTRSTMLAVLTDDLARAQAALDAAKMNAKKGSVSVGIEGFTAPATEAEEAVGKWSAEVVRLTGMLDGARKAQEELGKVAAKNAEDAMKRIADIKRAQEEAEAERLRKEREQLERKTIPEQIRKAYAELAGVGQTEYEKTIERIKSQEEEWLGLAVDRVLLEKWVASQTTLAAKKAEDAWSVVSSKMRIDLTAGVGTLEKELSNIKKQADEIRRQFKGSPGFDEGLVSGWEEDASRKARTKALMDEAKDNERRLKEQERYMEEYVRIRADAEGYVVNEHQRAINKIANDEEAAIAALYDIYDKSTGNRLLNEKMLEDGIAAIRAAGAAAKGEQARKELADQVAFYAEIEGYEQVWFARKVELINKERDMRIAAGWSVASANAAANQATGTARLDLFDKEHKGINEILAATKSAAHTAVGLFKEGSKAREVAHAIEVASSMAEMAIQAKKNLLIAVGAIAQQGTGDPYTAFARIAAMIALMGNVLSMAGMAFGGGGSSGAAAAPVLPASTVLGAAAGTGSESITKVWKLLEDTYTLEYRELTGIHDAMKELNQNITALVTSVVRTGGIDSMNIATGKSGGFAGAGVATGVLAAIAPPLLLIWEPVRKFLSHVFGGGTETFIVGGGLDVAKTKIDDLLAGVELSARQYADLSIKHFGWFGNTYNTYQTLYETLDSQTSDLLTLVYKGIGKTLVELSTGLGVDVNKALAYTFSAAKINLQGMTGEEINKTLSEYFSKIADDAVTALFGDMISKYQKLNEGLYETAARLITDKAVVNEILAMTNQQFTALDTAGLIAFSEALVEIAGGLDKLQESAATYYDKFFTDAEKQARLQMQLSGAMGGMGLALPGTREGYRSLVEALDLSTSAGQEAYVALLSMADAADKFYAGQQELADAQVKIWDDQLKAQQTLVDGLRARVDGVQKWLSEMERGSNAAVGSSLAWQKEYDRLKGMTTGAGATDQAVSDFLSYAKQYLGFQQKFTGGSYQDIYNAVMGDVRGIGDAAALQLPIAEQQLAAIQEADKAAREAAAALLTAVTGVSRGVPAYAAGGLSSGPSIFGERGPEWAVPTYEPQRSRFLRDVGADPDAIGRAVAKYVGAGGDGKDITVNLVLDGKVVTSTVIRGIRSGDQELIKSLRKATA